MYIYILYIYQYKCVCVFQENLSNLNFASIVFEVALSNLMLNMLLYYSPEKNDFFLFKQICYSCKINVFCVTCESWWASTLRVGQHYYRIVSISYLERHDNGSPYFLGRF